MEIGIDTTSVLSACRERAVSHEEEPPAVPQYVKFASVTNRQRRSPTPRQAVRTAASVPNRAMRTGVITAVGIVPPATPSSPAEGGDHPPGGGGDDDKSPTADPVDMPNYNDNTLPMSRSDCILLMHVAIASLLPQAAISTFSGLAPSYFILLVGDPKTAGSISSYLSAAGAVIALFATPIMSQMMDMFGRRLFAIISSLKALLIVLPMLAGGIFVYKNNGGAYGWTLEGHALHAFKVCLALWYAMMFLKSATFSSQGVVAIGDLFRNAHHRSIGIAVYQASMTCGTFASFIGTSLPLMSASIVTACIAVAGVIYNAVLFPETIELKQSKPITTIQREDEEGEESRTGDRDPLISQKSQRKQGGSSTRRCFYPEVEGDELTINNTPHSGINTTPPPPPAALYRPRRIQLLVSPLKGFQVIRNDPPSLVALLILCCFLFSEITAGDIVGFYLIKKLAFQPQDMVFLQIEMSVIQLLGALVVMPILARFFSCSTIATIASVCIAAALVLISLAEEKYVAFVGIGFSGFAIVAMPPLVAIITRKASTPEQVSLVISTVMVTNYALSAAGGIGAGMLFSLLPDSLLFLTFIVAAAFTLPMFCLSIYLRVLLAREERDEQQQLVEV